MHARPSVPAIVAAFLALWPLAAGAQAPAPQAQAPAATPGSPPTEPPGVMVTRFTSYLHSGPGLQYSVIDEIAPRTPFRPQCSAGWCRVVSMGGVVGWLEQSTLINGPSFAQPAPGERPVECMDFARTGWPNQGDLERVCIFKPIKPIEIDKPAG